MFASGWLVVLLLVFVAYADVNNLTGRLVGVVELGLAAAHKLHLMVDLIGEQLLGLTDNLVHRHFSRNAGRLFAAGRCLLA